MKKILLYLTIAACACNCKSRMITYNDPIPPYDSLIIASQHVNEDRRINIWTPPNYKESIDSLPVLYMPDGGIKEDFPHLANTLDTLLKQEKIPPLILVGIENTERGRDLTGFSEAEYDKQFCPVTDGAKDFRAFILEELMPEINKKYRTSNRKGLMGESLAGLFVMETFFTSPESFDFYVAMDPSLWWNNQYLTNHADSLLSQFPEKELRLWFAGSDAKDISPFTRSIAQTFTLHAPQKLMWNYSDEPHEKHHTIFRATKEKALIWTLKE